MNVIDCIRTRRSVRKYKSDPIELSVLEEVMEAATFAPSAINLQPWYYVVIQSPEKMEEMRGIMREVQAKFRPVLEERFPKHPNVVTDTSNFHNTLGNAPACILSFALKEDYADPEGVTQSVSASVENLMVAAWSKGLGTCWMNAARHMGFGEELRARFAPDKGQFMGAIAIGYPEAEGKAPPRKDGRFIFI